MDFLARVKIGSRQLPVIVGHPFQSRPVLGAAHYAVDKAERWGGAWVFGFLKGFYRERSLIRGWLPVDALVGGALTAASALLAIFTSGRSGIAPHLNALGDAGMSSYWNSMGTSYGAKKSGRQVLVLKQGQKPPAQIPAGYEAVGALPAAVGGAFLTADEIQNFSSGR